MAGYEELLQGARRKDSSSGEDDQPGRRRKGDSVWKSDAVDIVQTPEGAEL
jgi:hypothetical protein